VRNWFAAALLAAVLPFAAARAEEPVAAATPQPANRPRIGLVLSGGGARGAAHVGVLKVLEDLHVPIDAIAGTSMGAVVGGLYASGLSARAIETVLTSLDWEDAFRDRPPRADLNFRRKQEDQNFLVRLPVGLRGGDFLLPRGLIGGQKLTQNLRRLTLPVATVTDFDHLPTPFRAVATDLETGKAIVLSTGDLTEAMRASMAAPGVFTPTERDGRLLVDGGIADNLPIDVARAMHVDVLIVVDVASPLQSREKLITAPAISNQALAILINRNADMQKASLTARDVVIEPPLGEASTFDFHRLERSIGRGVAAAQAASARLNAIAVDARTYAEWSGLRAAQRLQESPRIEFVRTTPESAPYSEALAGTFNGLAGTRLDDVELAKRISALYGRGNLETLDWRLVHDDNRYGLLLDAKRNSWGPNYVRFGLNLTDDFAGNSSFNAAARFVLTEITGHGGEWLWDLQVGENPRIASEIYLPLSYRPGWFLSPQAQIEAHNVPLLDGQRRIAEFRVRTTEYGLDGGREFGDWGEFRVGLHRETGATRVRIGDPTLATSDFDARELFARLSYDRLDDVNFPRRGQAATLEWRGERTGLGSAGTADLLSLNYLAARSFGRNTAVFWASAGTNLTPGEVNVRTLYSLGGFLNLSGSAPGSITGPHFGIARFLYYRKIGSGGEGVFDVPIYAGLSFEAGNVWDRRGDMSFGSARKDGSLFLGFDTLLGPVYLGFGIADGGGTASYLFLGRTF
jgi:NTE family protein